MEQNPIADRNKLIQDERTLAVSIKKKFMQRKQEIRQRKTEASAKGKEDKARKNHKQFQEHDKLMDLILYYGLWQSVESVEQHLKTIQPKCEKVKCLYAQLQFRKVVLGQPFADSGVFNKTKNGKKLSVE